jgi:Nitrogen regulatory protein P-II
MVKIEVVVPTRLVDRVIDAIMKSAGTDSIGDGKIFVAGKSSTPCGFALVRLITPHFNPSSESSVEGARAVADLIES